MPGPLLAALSASPRKAAECVVIEAKDGTRVRFTSWSRAVTIDLGEGHGAEVCSTGMTLSQLTLAVGFDASYFEMSGALSEVITEAGINGGKWDDATAWLIRISPGVLGMAPMLKGKVREPRVEGDTFVFEVRNAADTLNQEIGVTVSAYCRTTFGSAKCGYDVPIVLATVTAAPDPLHLSVSYAGTYADDFFNLGKIEFTSGELAGVISDNLFDFVSGGAGAGSLVLMEPLSALPAIGDTLNLKIGCARIRRADNPAVRTCMFYNNTINFRGEPDVPGSAQVLSYAVPGA